MTSALQELSPNAEIVHSQQALAVNCAAASGLSQVLASNLGPKGTLKLLVGGTLDQLKLTKDGLTLLKEMQIQHPTAALIARTATAQDDITGDGTTSTVLLVGALLEQAQRQVMEGLHPRVLTKGYDLAREASLEFLKTLAQPLPFATENEETIENENDDTNNKKAVNIASLAMTNMLSQVATTTLGTKLDPSLVPKVCLDQNHYGLLYSVNLLCSPFHCFLPCAPTLILVLCHWLCCRLTLSFYGYCCIDWIT